MTLTGSIGKALNILQEIKTDSIECVLNSKLGSIRRMIATYGETDTRAFIIFLITDLLKSFNYNRNMNQEQMFRLTNVIVESYPHFVGEDFKRCFDGMKKGLYGRFFEGMDENKILDCIEQYDLKRQNEIIEFRKLESDNFKNLNKSVLCDNLLPVLKDVLKKIEDRPKAIKVTHKTERTRDQNIFDNYIKEFDKLYFEQLELGIIKKELLRLVVFNKKNCNLENYVNARYDEDFSKNLNE